MVGGRQRARQLPELGGAATTLRELEGRVEEAVAIARASEAAIMTVGAAAFDAAEQALRAAELAERASVALLGERPERLRAFDQRADEVAARLRALGSQQVSLAA